ncbi:MAG: CDP-alcohol phosphatidyltransferase family protein [Candidatus Zixiibacteriota bacterium]
MRAFHDFGRRIGEKLIYPPARLIGRLGIDPMVFTLGGFGLAVGAGVAFGFGLFRLGACLVLAAGLADMVDGAVARVNERGSEFGAFMDSVVDRYSEAAYLTGLIYFYAAAADATMTLLAALVLSGSVFVSYTKARAECFIESCKVGIMERPERVILLALGYLVGGYGPFVALLLLAVLSQFTAIQRIWYTRGRLLSRKPRK